MAYIQLMNSDTKFMTGMGIALASVVVLAAFKTGLLPLVYGLWLMYTAYHQKR